MGATTRLLVDGAGLRRASRSVALHCARCERLSGVTGSLEDQLTAVVGRSHVLTDAATRAPYEIDWTRRFAAPSRLVVRPATAAEVARVVRLCADAGAAIVAQGGNTGLVGGGVPRSGEVVLSLRRLAEITGVDAIAGRLLAGAGATLADVQRAAGLVGLEFGVDLAARDSATIGGMIATNAGGSRVIRHGTMRSQLLGVEAVLADGSVVSRLSGLAADSGGYDLAGLLAGSEGTLGIITKAAVRLVSPASERAVALLGVPDTAAALALLPELRRLPSLDAVEVFYADGLNLVCSQAGLHRPLERDWPAYLLVELAGTGAVAQISDTLAGLDFEDVALAFAPDDRRRLWTYREGHAAAITAAGVPHKLDVALPLDRLAEFVDALGPLVAALAPTARCVAFGHLGVGNLHVNILGLAADDWRVDEAILRLVAAEGGSVGAEHGIGFAKRDWLPLTRSSADIAAMRAIKRALDPAGLLNPGVLLPAESASAP